MKIALVDRITTPIGDLLMVVDGAYLCAVDFADCETRMWTLLNRRYGAVHLEPAVDPHGFASQLRAYFVGDLGALDTLPVDLGGTAFQREVWQALCAIPTGEVQTYGMIAERLGRPLSARAVGAANATNPVSVVVPCHRLVGTTGALTGYAGGMHRKAWLLRHEGVELAASGGRVAQRDLQLRRGAEVVGL